MTRWPASWAGDSLGRTAAAAARPAALGDTAPARSPRLAMAAESCEVLCREDWPPASERDFAVVVYDGWWPAAASRRAAALAANRTIAATTTATPVTSAISFLPRTGNRPLHEPTQLGQPFSPWVIGRLPTPGALWRALARVPRGSGLRALSLRIPAMLRSENAQRRETDSL